MKSRPFLLAFLALAATVGVVGGVTPRVRERGADLIRAIGRPARPAARRTTPRPAVLPAAPTIITPVVAPVRTATPTLAERFRLPGDAAPRSLQVISVPVPAELGTGPIDYVIRPVGLAELLSVREGRLEASNEPRAVTLVTRVPSNAAPGDLTVAEILFQGDQASLIVPVELVVSRLRRIILRPLRQSLAIRPAERQELAVQVQNLGNGVDTLRIGLSVPAGWKVAGDSVLILAPGVQQEMTFRLRAPTQEGYGTVPLHLSAMADTSTVARVQVAAEILPDAADAPREPGLTVVAGAATVAGNPRGNSPTFGVTLNGPLMKDVTLDGRFVATQDRSKFDTYSMSRIGYFLDGSYLSATGAKWRATAGRTGFGFSPIFGWNAYGLGASGELHVGNWALGGLAAQEQTAGVTGGAQLGARVMHPFAGGSLAISGTRLEQTFFNDRRLDAIGATYSFAPRPGATLTLESGWRRTGHLQGAAGSVGLITNGLRRRVDLYAAHAPGGTDGFARATDEFSGGYWQALREGLAVRVNGYSLRDEPGTGGSYRSRGITTGPTLALSAYTSVDLTVNDRTTVFEGREGQTSGHERLATLTGRSLIGPVAARLAVSAGRAGRERIDTLGLRGSSSGNRVVVRGGGDFTTSRGLYQIDASLEKNQTATGGLPSLGYVSIEGTSLRPFSFRNAPRFNLGVWKNIYAGAPSGAGFRLGTVASLPGDFIFTMIAERNPYLLGGATTPWVATFKIERGVRFAAMRRPTARGLVYDDLDGSGDRSVNEPGLAGVVVRRGDQTAVTRADGSFRFFDPLPPTFVPQVESGSLSMGQVAPVLATDTTRRDWQLPVVRTRRVAVRMVPTADSLARIPTTPLNEIKVIAADSTGALWMAHADTLGNAIFDALPPGHYTITLDFSQSTERLRMLISAPNIEVGPGGEIPNVTIPFGFRAVRLFDGSNGGGGGQRR